MLKTKKQFDNLTELYNTYGYFYEYGKKYADWVTINHTDKKPYLLCKITGEKITGLKNINKYMKFNHLEVEV